MSRYAKVLLSERGQAAIDRFTARGMNASGVIDCFKRYTNHSSRL